jgi:flavin prenyltransferase
MKATNVVVAITGASGSIYAKVLCDKLQLLQESGQVGKVALLMSENAKTVWEHELGNLDYVVIPFTAYEKMDFMAPFASGSSTYKVMFVTPCSMGTMGRIANGISDDLLTRAADVMLKERRKLILNVRETPYHAIHLQQMLALTQAGAIICPATPSFYSKPVDFEALAATVVDRMLSLAGFFVDMYRWNED